MRSSVSACAAISFGRSATARATSSSGVRSGSGGSDRLAAAANGHPRERADRVDGRTVLVVEQMPDPGVDGDLRVGQRRLPGGEVLRRHDPVDRAPLDQDRHRQASRASPPTPGRTARGRSPPSRAPPARARPRTRRRAPPAAGARPRSSPRSSASRRPPPAPSAERGRSDGRAPRARRALRRRGCACGRDGRPRATPRPSRPASGRRARTSRSPARRACARCARRARRCCWTWGRRSV